MEKALLIDIGSTYTKVSLVDLSNAELIARSRAYTTIEEGVNIGLKNALSSIKDWYQAEYKLACSSAAGGLRMIAVGLVPELTAEAARRAALGAGSKVIKTYAYQLTEEDIKEIEQSCPDIILLAGGTDGGNKENIILNARKLAESKISLPIIIAGNRSAADIVKIILQDADKEIYLTENVMPELEKLNIEPARELIREIFLKKIIIAKGLTSVNKIIDGIIMPTPSAVLQAAGILAEGCGDETGLGELIVVDVGGATTDVHSVATGKPTRSNVNWHGLQEPYQKRTVEGDLGMRYSMETLFEAVDEDLLKKQLLQVSDETFSISDCHDLVERLSENPEQNTMGEESEIENILAYNAVRISTARHVGVLKTIYTPLGSTFIQEGKDLTGIKYVIGTGGIIVNNERPEFILSGALYNNQQNPQLLAPIEPGFMVDSEYILAAGGLIAEIDPEKACGFMKKYLQPINKVI
ncbi:MAG: methylaspartate mutase accessory protein GlmL [Halanaerobiales bacterium]